ncbi:MAG: hypothetical protein JNK15_07900, partial [Planctomycetes bacterium]|nr:hypothetical protein [Planctomycetota bacterium]
IAPQSSPFPYYGVASPTAMWKFYDEGPPGGPMGQTALDVGIQLDWVKRTGFNSVRVFLSYPAWFADKNSPTGNAFVRRFKHFVGQCHARGLRVMPVLWDGVAVHPDEALQACLMHPDYSDPWGDVWAVNGYNSNISYWHRNPGQKVMDAIQAAATTTPFEYSDAGLYIRDCISVFHDPVQNYSQALLMWDVMNEARCGDLQWWITESLRTIKFYAPGDTTTWGWIVSNHFPESRILSLLPTCDVLSLHCYSQRKGAVEAQLYDAVFFDTSGQEAHTKPVIFTEIGHPGLAYSYQDAVAYCAASQRPGASGPSGQPGSGPSSWKGVGFMPWQFSIGYYQAGTPPIQDRMPFSNSQGLFYSDGEVRDLDVIVSFVEHAKSHGVASGLWGQGGLAFPNEKNPLDPHRVPEDWLVEFACEQDQDRFMTQLWMYSLPIWTWEQFVKVDLMLLGVFANGVWPGAMSTDNKNPWLWLPGTPQGVSWIPGYAPYTPTLISLASEAMPFTPEFAAMLMRLEVAHQLAPGSLRPWDNGPTNPDWQADIDLVVEQFLGTFAQELGQCVVPR